jgi:hypothetical protein
LTPHIFDSSPPQLLLGATNSTKWFEQFSTTTVPPHVTLEIADSDELAPSIASYTLNSLSSRSSASCSMARLCAPGIAGQEVEAKNNISTSLGRQPNRRYDAAYFFLPLSISAFASQSQSLPYTLFSLSRSLSSFITPYHHSPLLQTRRGDAASASARQGQVDGMRKEGGANSRENDRSGGDGGHRWAHVERERERERGGEREREMVRERETFGLLSMSDMHQPFTPSQTEWERTEWRDEWRRREEISVKSIGEDQVWKTFEDEGGEKEDEVVVPYEEEEMLARIRAIARSRQMAQRKGAETTMSRRMTTMQRLAKDLKAIGNKLFKLLIQSLTCLTRNIFALSREIPAFLAAGTVQNSQQAGYDLL